MFNYYVISFRLCDGNFKEYYVYCDKEDLIDKVKDLTKKFFEKEDLRDVYIYEHIDTLYLEDIF